MATKDTDYAYAVARVRANENGLLTAAELSAAAAAPDFTAAAQRLRDKGYEIGSEADVGPQRDQKLADARALLEEILPDPAALDPLTVYGDFHNLKVILKGLLGGKDPAPYLTRPCVWAPERIREAVFSRENDALPEPLRHAERSAYRILTKTRSSQLADAVIDRAALEWSLRLAKDGKEPAVLAAAERRAALTDLKILRRCMAAGKAESFLRRSVCDCAAFTRDALVAAAGRREAVAALTSASPLAPLAGALDADDVAFEKACDDFENAALWQARWQAFGIEPLLAYDAAVKTEVLNVRILLCGKRTGLPEQAIRERMRGLYA